VIGVRNQIAVLICNLGPHAPEAINVEIKSPGTNVVSAWQGNIRRTAARNERAQDTDRRTHPADEIVISSMLWILG
jgi:hypothetical protein